MVQLGSLASMVRIVLCCLLDAKPLTETMMEKFPNVSIYIYISVAIDNWYQLSSHDEADVTLGLQQSDTWGPFY